MQETRDVEVIIQADEVVLGMFTIWEESPEDAENVRLDLSFGDETMSATSEEGYFDALVAIRRQLESKGINIRCYGTAENVYPSPMIRSMGGGDQAYKLTLGKPSDMVDLVSIFDSDTEIVPVSVEKQAAFYENWLDSL